MPQHRNKVGMSFRLTPSAVELINQLAQRLGLSQAGVLELAVRKLATSEGVTIGDQEDTNHE